MPSPLYHRLILALAGIAVAAPGGMDAQASALDADVVPVVRYGWYELADSTRRLSDTERRMDAGVLGVIAGIAEGPDGEILVLDRSFQKVVVFERDGQLKQVIRGGYGRGPGEFVRPRAIAVNQDGRIAVLDDGQRRITIFSADGEVLHTIPVRKMLLRILFSNGRLYATDYKLRGDDVMVWEVDPSDGSLIPVLRESGLPVRLGLFGEPGTLGISREGNALYGYAVPGSWRELRPGGASPVTGEPVFPWVEPQLVERERAGRVRTVLLGSRAIGSLSDGRVAVVYEVNRNAPRDGDHLTDPGRGFMLALFSEAGAHIGTDDLLSHDDNGWHHFVISRFEEEVLVATVDPYPQVVRFSLRVR